MPMATISDGVQLLPEKDIQQRASKTLLFGVAIYCVSQIKFFTRDPLANETGPQGPIELLLVIAASLVLLSAARRFHRRPFFTTAAESFLVFGVLTAFSSIYSFDPRLSVLKALAFLLVCGIAVMASSTYRPVEVLKCFYYSVTTIVIIGLLLKVVSTEPLFAQDEYSGRARFTMFAWDPGAVADLCALTLLISTLFPKRPPLYFQVLLFAINVAAGARTSTALLVVVLLWQIVASLRITPRLVFVWCSLGFIVTLIIGVGLQMEDRLSPDIAGAAQSLYGIRLEEDMPTLNGRTEVWQVAAPLLSRSLVLGYGFEGTREALVNNTSWGAGHSHNSIFELVLSGGVPAAFLFLFGWATSAKRAWDAQMPVRTRILGIYAYIAAFGMTEPNLTYLQGLAVFLIITLDSWLYVERSRIRVAEA